MPLAGFFSQRWQRLATAYGARCTRGRGPWGPSRSPAAFRERRAPRNVKARAAHAVGSMGARSPAGASKACAVGGEVGVLVVMDVVLFEPRRGAVRVRRLGTRCCRSAGHRRPVAMRSWRWGARRRELDAAALLLRLAGVMSRRDPRTRGRPDDQRVQGVRRCAPALLSGPSALHRHETSDAVKDGVRAVDGFFSDPSRGARTQLELPPRSARPDGISADQICETSLRPAKGLLKGLVFSVLGHFGYVLARSSHRPRALRR